MALWALWLMVQVRPTDPRISPIFGNLSGLPPTLVQASESEVLFDDGRRYVNKAVGEGSPAEFESWPGLLHVFQAFAPEVPEANEALSRAGAFLERCAPRVA